MSLPYDKDIPSNTLLSVATDAARQAGAVLTECVRTGFRIEHKEIINLVTDADHQAEQRIIDVIHAAFPTHHVLSEERGLTEQSPSRYKWVIHPLDGTTNFADWTPVVTNTLPAGGAWQLLLPAGTNPHLFYRARLEP